MSEPVTLTFIFETIAVILGLTGIAILGINYRTRKIKEN